MLVTKNNLCKNKAKIVSYGKKSQKKTQKATEYCFDCLDSVEITGLEPATFRLRT